ncbi:MAG: ATP-binding cassette domain-containing protein [Haliscomenobacter sp.]|nr:ATP-binding cassette domain-containing protein [Haliscomenobacter sp.]MBP9077130.1 ATP-binding cassette domain-containing protein [Haliscomenobacter sp.]MBP9872730.1 ATP-binding cassette domain-containing protein [Haliscomenobacter sp.]
MTNHPILRLEEVLKAYDQKIAVDRVTLSVPKGAIFGMLGPNGAGKTSLIRIITTITQADSGKVFLDGEPLNSKHPEFIGYMPEERGLYKKMKVGDHLLYLGRLKGLSKAQTEAEIRHWFEKLEISDWWNKKVEELSKGMQQKIQFIATVIHRPKLLILDEPFSGLDPINTNLIKDEIYQLHQEGTSIIFSTHRMEQVEEICEHIVLINQGKNILEGEVKAIRNQFKEHQFRIDFEGNLPEDLPSKVRTIKENGGSAVIQLLEGAESNQLLGYLIDRGVRIKAFNELLPSLNEIFIRQVEQSNAGLAAASGH